MCRYCITDKPVSICDERQLFLTKIRNRTKKPEISTLKCNCFQQNKSLKEGCERLANVVIKGVFFYQPSWNSKNIHQYLLPNHRFLLICTKSAQRPKNTINTKNSKKLSKIDIQQTQGVWKIFDPTGKWKRALENDKKLHYPTCW